MKITEAEMHAKEIARRIGEKIRRELLNPELDVRTLLVMVEQMASLARVEIDEAMAQAA
jgi:hypothetical protein